MYLEEIHLGSRGGRLHSRDAMSHPRLLPHPRLAPGGSFVTMVILFLCCLLAVQQGVFARDQQRSEDQQVQQAPAESGNYRQALVSLCDPAKLATLGDRGANPRLKKIVYWLEQAREAGNDPARIIDEVLQQNHYGADHAALIKTNLLRNIKICDELGFFTFDNLSALRRGNAPMVMRGPYVGDQGQVDHIIPFSVAPEIGNDLANLELMPGKLNNKKRAKVGQRQKSLARDLRAADVINDRVLNRILAIATASDSSLNPAPVLANDEPVGSQVISPQPLAASMVIVAPTASVPAQPPLATTVMLVWVNTATGVYHMPGTRSYGRTTHGQYMSEGEAIKAGDRKARNGQ